MRFSPYWQSATPLCLTETRDGMTRALVPVAGRVSLTMPDPLDAVLGGPAAADCDSS